MTLDELKQAFVDAHPRAIDFPRKVVDALEPDASRVAHEAGYRLAGYRKGRAVFTTKARP